MAGFLDDQTLLTASSLGADAEDYDVTVLSNGDVLVGYFSRNSGPMSMYTYDVKSDSSGFSSGLGQSGFSPMNDPNVVTLANGGYGAVVQRAIGNLTTDKRLVYQKYNADGTEDGALIELDSGFVTDVFATTTSKGFFVAYEQRTNDDFVSGSFYNANGKLLKQIDLTADLNVTTSRIDAASLSNGNVAVVMGSDFQIFSASGATVGNLVSFADQLAVGNGPTTASVAAKDGGFMISYGLPGDIDVVRVQQYDNQGRTKGGELVMDLAVEGFAGRNVNDVRVAYTKEGLIAVAWHGQELVNSGNFFDTYNDVFYAIYTDKGTEIVGPSIATETVKYDQENARFTTLKNGNLFLTYKDGETVQFSHVGAIMGRAFTSPDTIYEGNGKNNVKDGTSGDDVMLGLGGKDTLNGGKGEDLLRGGDGDDTLKGGDKSDVLNGEAGNDTLDGGKGGDEMSGGSGDDIVKGGAGDDRMLGGDGGDRLSGGGGNDNLDGGTGADKLFGGGGSDTLSASAGKNLMKGGGGDDTMTGGVDNDRMLGQSGNDRIVGGAGNDKLLGGTGFDSLFGGEGDDVLRGEDDNDILNGDAGNDKEYGGAGDDSFYDSDGNDRLWGEAGADTFFFLDTDFGKDRIKDFEFGVDVLDMGNVARALQFAGLGDLTVRELKAGVRVSVDADNWVLVEGAKLSDFADGDLITDVPF